MRPTQGRCLEIEQFGAVTVVRILDRELVHPERIDVVGGRLRRVADELGARWVVLNLRRIEGVGSAMIGKILGLYKRLQAVGGRLALCDLGPGLLQVLELLRLTALFPIHASEQAAVGALQPAADQDPPPR